MAERNRTAPKVFAPVPRVMGSARIRARQPVVCRYVALSGISLLFLAITANAIAVQPLPHEAYIWQRVWTPAVTTALHDTRALFQGWRVLVAEVDASGAMRTFAVNWAELTHKPVTAVVRIDGTLLGLDTATLSAAIRQLATTWPDRVPIEIDHDCGTSRLLAYAKFLATLRGDRRLSITALPAWLESADLSALLAVVDETVLQVHAVRAPAQGLFDTASARRWIDAFAQRTDKPFRVSLPDYGTRIIRDQEGSVVAIESETPRLIGGTTADELMAMPETVAALLRDLNARRPKHLLGIAWFRLPVAGDQRIWSLPTLTAVIHGKPLAARLTIEFSPGQGVRDVVLSNSGSADGELPAAIVLPSACQLADGINGYRYEARGHRLVRQQIGLIRSKHSRVIGWARCGATAEDFHVQP